MRSRYTAFAIGDVDHLLGTWHPGTAPEDVTIDPALRWDGLTVIAVERGGVDDRRGVVEFAAAWREGSETGALHERSRFVHQGGRWWYLDGEVRG